MPAVPSGYGYGSHGPTCYEKMKLGFMNGFIIGLAMGAIFSPYPVWRSGLRGRQLVAMCGKYMMQSGGSFGVFMTVGQGLRC